ncbi:acyl-CoA dehydrogenase family protein [Streptomyces sp. NPDC087422]|uniref:acyl-CoA dehydrogenase family protein n=1 Tax=Streptomyces sp. NPDC087422 TaxID=3365786 RepID=UPI003820E6DF
MRLAPTPDEQLFARTARELLAARCTPADVRAGFSRDRWRALAGIGATGLLVPEEYGGLGLGSGPGADGYGPDGYGPDGYGPGGYGPGGHGSGRQHLGGRRLDEPPLGAQALVALTEEAGRACLPEPLLEAAVAAELLGGLPEGADLLRGLAEGAVTVAVSLPARVPAPGPVPASASVRTSVPTSASVSVSEPAGQPVVAHAAHADHVLVVTEDGELREAGAGPRTPVAGVDPNRGLARGAEGGGSVLAREWGEAAGKAARLGAIGAAADLVGAAAAMLERTVDYAKGRVQFGSPIGERQAVKHRLADVLLAVEFARPVVARAAYAYDHGLPSAARDAAMAKVFANEAAGKAARGCLQVHGAIGYTDEYDLSLWLRRVWALSAAWGDSTRHRAAVAADLFAPGGPSPSCPPR